ncbi:hypothetical protein DL89DRAFT_270265 [Linderina pennispora]|uniref:Uncharacterized protein n=1 Tax=Linderina pennispora TaxID=61395 RepID=A0A1Y1VZR3_9FUNG|nr:uncharacterized protein DL89DRAFT_270265 [Linderina pennispora]ORX66344.1 hypothetical protein DL89DRAFT_270265 [Linderina pennispora]
MNRNNRTAQDQSALREEKLKIIENKIGAIDLFGVGKDYAHYCNMADFPDDSQALSQLQQRGYLQPRR